MDYKLAHKIINSRTPVSELSNNWAFNIEDKQVKVYSEFDFFHTSFVSFVKNYIDKLRIEDNKIIGEYRHSSVGFISEEDYFYAQDLLSENRIKFSELIDNNIYQGNNGKKYIYKKTPEIYLIDFDTSTRTFSKKIEKTSFFLIEYNEENELVKTIRLNSVKLIKEIGVYGSDTNNFLNKEILSKIKYLDFIIDRDNFRFSSTRIENINKKLYLPLRLIDLPTKEEEKEYTYKNERAVRDCFNIEHLLEIKKTSFLRGMYRFIKDDKLSELNIEKYLTKNIYIY